MPRPSASSMITETTPRVVDVATPIHVAGIAARTSNERERDPETAAIPALWGRFAQEVRSSSRPDDRAPVFSVYTEYESDVTGRYTVVVGREAPLSALAEKVATIPPGRYLEFTSSGEIPAAVIAGWAQVWAYFERSGTVKRAYSADFERYDADAPQTVRIYVGVA